LKLDGLLPEKNIPRQRSLRWKHIALPAEHGAWVFLSSPLAIGLALGGVTPASLLLVVGALAAFLIRQPVTIAVKAYSGRRAKSELGPAAAWLAIYGLIGLATLAGLLALGYGRLLWLAVPALPILAWHLYLVSRRAERRQALMEIVASGVLALAAPAAYWVGLGSYDAAGWGLWALAWLQVTGTILYAYLRLEQRQWKAAPLLRAGLVHARPALVFNLAAFALVLGLALAGLLPRWLPLAYLIQPLETLWGTLHPAVGVKPKHIGIRQLIVSVLFTVVFILLWRLPV
jgi:hypothetical protein